MRPRQRQFEIPAFPWISAVNSFVLLVAPCSLSESFVHRCSPPLPTLPSLPPPRTLPSHLPSPTYPPQALPPHATPICSRSDPSPSSLDPTNISHPPQIPAILHTRVIPSSSARPPASKKLKYFIECSERHCTVLESRSALCVPFWDGFGTHVMPVLARSRLTSMTRIPVSHRAQSTQNLLVLVSFRPLVSQGIMKNNDQVVRIRIGVAWRASRRLRASTKKQEGRETMAKKR
ncbi:hypothetical protein B0H12DRAFT_122997 [Mycena haematopus]|nr:hypothetical protein B0H12DRAFT_122997 [Mycena haematopus]